MLVQPDKFLQKLRKELQITDQVIKDTADIIINGKRDNILDQLRENPAMNVFLALPVDDPERFIIIVNTEEKVDSFKDYECCPFFRILKLISH